MQFLTNLVAFASPVFLFGFWWLVGYSTLAALYTKRNSIQNMLLAPAVGMACTLLMVFLFNHAGFPVKQCALAVTGLLLLMSASLWWKYRPFTPWKYYLAFAGMLLIALWITGRPFLSYGFAWLSYANDDMANYSLGAVWFLHHGYNASLNMNEMLHNRDYSMYLWFMYIPGMVRVGSELLLAWVSDTTQLTPDKIFMPVILAMHLTLISASAALVYQSRRFRLAALTVCGLMSISAMVSLGTFYQLIAQVGGGGLLIACLIVLLKPFSNVDYKTIFRFGLLTAILVSALLIDYPELLPFLVLSFFCYHTLLLIKKIKPDLKYIMMLGIAALLSILILNTYLISIVGTLVTQVAVGFLIINIKKSMFPYFLLPSGLADLWGFHAIAFNVPEPFLSISIFIGVFLSLFVFIGAFVLAYRCYVPAITFLIMAILTIRFFISNNDFGLFKLAMYMQPYMLATVVVMWFYIARRPLLRWIPIFLFVLTNLFFQYIYLERSRNSIDSDIPDASKTRITYEFEQLVYSHKSVKHWVLDTSIMVLEKYQALYLREREAVFLSRRIFYYLTYGNAILEQINEKLAQDTKRFHNALGQLYKKSRFDLHDAAHPTAANFFNAAQFKVENDTIVVMNTGKQTIINRRVFPENLQYNFVALPWKKVHNHLVFITSMLGQHYYLTEKYNFDKTEPKSPEISYYGLEKDYFYPEQKISAIGRHLLFEVINPSPKVRMALTITSTLNNDGSNQLPKAAVIGKQRKLFPIIGRGSARVFSPPVDPQIINNASYLALDMGIDGKVFPYKRFGLMTIYGREVGVDKRSIVGFARDISLVSEQQYRQLKAPSFVSHFPADLTNPDLEYSGVYEDGLVSESVFFSLQQQNTTPVLLINGFIPFSEQNKTPQKLTILVNGKKIGQKNLTVGYFSVKIPLSATVARKRIELHFSEVQGISKGDIRPVAAKLYFIGFVSDSEATALTKAQEQESLIREQPSIRQKIHKFYLRIKDRLDSL